MIAWQRQIFFWVFAAGISMMLWNLFVLAPRKEIVIYFPKQELRIYAEVADTNSEQERGLMERGLLKQDRGMLFVFDSEARRSFWMKNTKIPLDIIFISEDKRIIDIKENFEPCKADLCEIYTSVKPAKYALEVNAGFVEAHNILIGEEMR